MMLLRRLLAVCLIVCAIPAAAQFFNISRVARPSETTFGNSGQPWPLLATNINAENYDQGGQGVAFNSPPDGRCTQSTPYRPDTANFNVSTDGPAYQLGCSAVGLWYNYTMNAPTSGGPYVLSLRAADGAPSAGGSWAILIDNVQVATVSVPLTGGYTTFQVLTSGQFNVSAGNHVLQLKVATGDGGNGAGDISSFSIAPPVVVSGIACDIGPNVTAIPAPASAGGFTHCAANADFTTSTTDANGINFSNVATFIDECGATTPWRWYLRSFSYSLPCSGRAAIVTDTGVTPNTQALQLTYSLADQTNCVNYASPGPAGQNCGRADNPYSTTGFIFPQYFSQRTSGSLPMERYFEYTVRIPQNSMATYAGNDSLFTVVDFGSQPGNVGLNSMDTEFRGTGNGSPGNTVNGGWGMASQGDVGNGVIGTCTSAGLGICGNNGPLYGGWDVYHTWGFLITSDESSIMAECAYRDGVLQGCEYVNPPPANGTTLGPPDYTDKSRTIQYLIGNSVQAPACSGTNGCVVNGTNVLQTSLRIWECPNYKTTGCPGPVIR